MNLSTNTDLTTVPSPEASLVALDQLQTVSVVELPQRFDVHADVDLDGLVTTPGTTLLVDGSSVAFADMASLQSLVDARLAALDSEGDLVIALPSDELRATLELTGFDTLVPVFAGGAQ